MHVFYAPQACYNIFQLPQDESEHCLKVLRFRKGDRVVVSNGKGLIVNAVLEDENMSGVTLQYISEIYHLKERLFHLHIAISPLKNPTRLEWFIEKASELKTAEITPLICKRTEKPGFRLERMQRIALEAMKQSASPFLTQINEPADFRDFIKEPQENARFIAACNQEKFVTMDKIAHANVLVLIGPEGDFTDEEVDAALKSGFQILNMGDARLRSETAGVFAAATMYFKNLLS